MPRPTYDEAAEDWNEDSGRGVVIGVALGIGFWVTVGLGLWYFFG